MLDTSQGQWLMVDERRMESQGLMGQENSYGQQELSGVSLVQLATGLRRHAARILCVALAVALAAFLVSKRMTPMYESTATLEVNPDRTSDLLGPDATHAAWNDSDQMIATQLRVMQEDSVLRPVVQQYNLPLETAKDSNAPIVLKRLKVLRPPNTYLIQVSYRSSDSVLAADVANGIAESYLRHVFKSRLADRKSQTSFMEQQLDEVRASMERSAKAVNEFEAKLGVVDAQDKTNIVSARLLQLSTEYTAAQADRIKKQADYMGLRSGTLQAAQESEQGENLKSLSTALEQAEQKFVEVREHYGTKHPEYAKQAAILAGLRSQLEDAKGMVSLRGRVAYEDALSREQILQKELAEEKAGFDKLNATSYQYQALKIEAEGNRKLYDDLERRIKEATINGSFQNSTTHLSDPARPADRAIFPRVGLNVGLAFGFTLILGIVVALLAEMSDDTIRSAAEMQSTFHTEVLGVLPKCDLPAESFVPATEEWLPKPIVQVPKTGFSAPVFSSKRQQAQRALYEEAVRMMWSSFQLATVERGIHSLLITSAMPEEGKTTLTTRLALVHAGHDRRTLLIDADLRRPSAHRYTHVPMCPGLAEAVRGDDTWRAFVVQSSLHSQLDVLPAGALSARSCDDLSQMLPRILAEAECEYDLILVDGPPLLAFADPLHMASAVDGVIVVVCAEKTSRKAIGLMLQTLKRVRANLLGVALNRVSEAGTSTSYSYRDYTNREAA